MMKRLILCMAVVALVVVHGMDRSKPPDIVGTAKARDTDRSRGAGTTQEPAPNPILLRG